MSSNIDFDEETSRRVESTYITPDVISQRKELIQLLSLQAGEHVIDIGSGPGLLSSDIGELVGPAGKVCGVDVSEHMVAIASRRCTDKPWIEFQTANALSLPYSDSSFDVAVSTQVFEYIDDVPSALREVHHVLRPGGRLLILDTDWDSVVWHSSNRGRMNRILEAWNDHCTDPFLPRTLATGLREQGFAIMKQGVIEILNTECSENTYSYWLIDLIVKFISGKGETWANEVLEWAEDLRKMAENRAYFFSLNRYYFMGVKSAP